MLSTKQLPGIPSTTGRGYFGIALFNPKNNWNIGGSLRALQAFNGDFGIITGRRYSKVPTDTGDCARHILIFSVEDPANLWNYIPHECTPVSVELTDNARDIRTFVHPERALYIFGPEDGSLPEGILGNSKHVIKMSTKMCLNLAAAVNVVLYDRSRKYL